MLRRRSCAPFGLWVSPTMDRSISNEVLREVRLSASSPLPYAKFHERLGAAIDRHSIGAQYGVI
jgi:hypothetical protein